MPSIPAVSNYIPSHLPVDLVALALFAFVVAIDSYRSGTRRAAVFTLAVPIAITIYRILPITAFVGPWVSSLATTALLAGLFGALLILLLILLYRIVPTSFGSGPIVLQSILAALAASALLAVAWTHVPALSALWAPSPLISMFFGVSYGAYWILLALVGLASVRR